MPGTFAYKGSLSIAGLCPIIVGATAAALLELQAKLQGVLALSAQLTITPPSVSAGLELAVQMVAACTLALEIQLPGIDFQIQAVAALLAQIEANLALLLALQALLGIELFVYTYVGDTQSFGTCVSASLVNGWPDGSSPRSPAFALVLATVVPSVWASVRVLFAGAA